MNKVITERIAYTVTSCGTGGASRLGLEIIKRLNISRNLEVFIFGVKESDDTEAYKQELTAAKVKFTTIPIHSVVSWVNGVKSLTKDFDIIITDHWYPVGVILSLLSRFRIHKFKYYCWVYGLDMAFTRGAPMFKRIFKQLFQQVVAKSYGMLTISKYTENQLYLRAPSAKGKTTKILCGAEHLLAIPPTKARKQTKEINLLFVGRVVERKGVHLVIDALHIIKEEYGFSDFIFTILGAGPMIDPIKKRIVEYKLEEHVTLLGKAPDPEKVETFSTSDLFIMPSRNIDGDFEGFGIVYVEALLYGVPIIAGFDGGGAEIVTPGVNGFIVDGISAQSIAATLYSILKYRLFEKLDRQAIIHSGKAFTWDKAIEVINKELG